MAELFAIDDRALLSVDADVVFGPEDDVREHTALGNHKVIALTFPKWRDGRAYSSAQILRENGFTGDIRAVGDLTVDQLVALKRSGFSSLAPEREIDLEVAQRTLTRFSDVYQDAKDAGVAAWRLRHQGKPA